MSVIGIMHHRPCISLCVVVQSLSPVSSRRDRIGCSHARNGLSEYLTGGDQPQCLHVDEITSVGIQKAVAVCIGMQIEP